MIRQLVFAIDNAIESCKSANPIAEFDNGDHKIDCGIDVKFTDACSSDVIDEKNSWDYSPTKKGKSNSMHGK